MFSAYSLAAFAFFADRSMQSFYRRFVRDYMRYKDEIQCAGAELVGAVRADARRLAPSFHGAYYALHIRRGDFQFKVRLMSLSVSHDLSMSIFCFFFFFFFFLLAIACASFLTTMSAFIWFFFSLITFHHHHCS